MWRLIVCLAGLCAACGGPNAAPAEPAAPPPSLAQPHADSSAGEAPTGPEATASATATPAPAEPAAAPAQAGAPTLAELQAGCGSQAPCIPPKALAERLCRHIDPDLALALFQHDTPFKRVYSRRDFEAWYIKGGRTSPRRVRLSEELILLVERTHAGGMVVSGSAGSYDVYRWDGSCVSVQSDEVSAIRPSTPDVATIPWRRLHSRTQKALLKSKKITFRNDRRRTICKKAGRGTDKCKAATHDLSRLIAHHLRTGGTLSE